jgi:tetratricopeptide (TPR) repeat protein
MKPFARTLIVVCRVSLMCFTPQTIGNLDQAKRIYQECVDWKLGFNETSRSLFLAYNALGDIGMEQRNHTEARGHYEKALNVLDAMQVQSDDVDYKLLTGKLRFLQQDLTGSLESLDLALNAIKQAPKNFMDQSAYDLRCISRTYQAHRDLPEAINALQESLSLTDSRSFSLERAAGLHDLANCLFDQDETSAGLMSLEQSLEIRILKLGECLQVLDTLNAIGNVHMSLGAQDEAMAVFDKVHELTLNIAPDDVERTARVLYSIGEVFDAKKEYTEAVQKFTECMEVLKQDRSPDHPHIAKALQRLGDVTSTQGDLLTAFTYYGEALRIRRLNDDERLVAETLHSIGVLTRRRKTAEEARQPLLDALDIRRKLKNGRETGETLFEIGNTFRLQMETEEAVSLYQKSLEILSVKDKDIRANVFLALGHAYLTLKKDPDALSCYEQALEIRLAAYGKNSMKTGNIARSIGLCKYLMNLGDEAMVFLNEFIRVIELNDEEEHEEEGEDIDYIVAVLLMFDVHLAKKKNEQASTLLGVAKEVCSESEDVRTGAPGLIHMIDRRDKKINSGNPSNAGGERRSLLMRAGSLLNLKEEAGVQLVIAPEDESILRQIIFIDD